MSIRKYFAKVDENALVVAANESNLTPQEEVEVLQSHFSKMKNLIRKNQRTNTKSSKKSFAMELLFTHKSTALGMLAKSFKLENLQPVAFNENKITCAETKEIKTGKRGPRTMLLSEIDEKVLEMVKRMRNAGAVSNFHTFIEMATGIAKDRTLLKEYDGNVKFSVGWCQSIFKRLNFVRQQLQNR